MSRKYRIAGNFRGRKLSRFFSHPRKFSPRNSRHATPIMLPFHESFLCEMLLSTDLRKFFPSKISCYMVRGRLDLWLIQVCMTNAKCLSGQSPQLLLPLQIQCKFIVLLIGLLINLCFNFVHARHTRPPPPHPPSGSPLSRPPCPQWVSSISDYACYTSWTLHSIFSYWHFGLRLYNDVVGLDNDDDR